MRMGRGVSKGEGEVRCGEERTGGVKVNGEEDERETGGRRQSGAR